MFVIDLLALFSACGCGPGGRARLFPPRWELRSFTTWLLKHANEELSFHFHSYPEPGGKGSYALAWKLDHSGIAQTSTLWHPHFERETEPKGSVLGFQSQEYHFLVTQTWVYSWLLRALLPSSVKWGLMLIPISQGCLHMRYASYYITQRRVGPWCMVSSLASVSISVKGVHSAPDNAAVRTSWYHECKIPNSDTSSLPSSPSSPYSVVNWWYRALENQIKYKNPLGFSGSSGYLSTSPI